MKAYANLHNHTYYSFLESSISPEKLCMKAQEMGIKGLCIADTNGGYGHIDFLNQCKKYDIKPLFGVQIALTTESRLENRAHKDGKEGHIVLMSMTDNGHKNLLQLISKAHLEGYYHQPRVDYELINMYSDGVLMLTGGVKSPVLKLFIENGRAAAEAYLDSLYNHCRSIKIVLELITRPTNDIKEYNIWLTEYAIKHHKTAIIACDNHYNTPDDYEATEALQCIMSGRKLDDMLKTPTIDNAYIRSFDMIDSELDYIDNDFREQCRINSITIMDECTVNIQLGKYTFPNFPIDSGETADSMLYKKCYERIDICYKDTDIDRNVILERLEFETQMIAKMGFSSYFLIVEDFISWAKERHIAVGPGRGSAAGAIVAYLLGITTIDPLKYDLLFERFLNPERVSMPDIDIDFSDERRHEVMHGYLRSRYGNDKVSQVCTFGRLTSKAAIKDMGRVLGVDFQTMNTLTKLLPNDPKLKVKNIKEHKEFMRAIENNDTYTRMLELAGRVEGSIRQLGVHACAVILAPENMSYYTPLQRSPSDDNVIITQYDGNTMEALGMLKMDFLGLSNLTTIEHTLSHIKALEGIDLDMTAIPIDDKEVFKMLSEGSSTGVFQFEAVHLKRILKEMKPDNFEDLVALSALNRPGPQKFIPDYIKRKHGKEAVPYPEPEHIFKPILEKTYGIAIYQEQILRIAQEYAGFSLGEADLLRRAIGKKKLKELAEQREKFIRKSVEMGHDEQKTTKLFDEWIVPFSDYGFNRSHSVSYSRISYETAYLRAHYPVEFMASLMTSEAQRIDKLTALIAECNAMDITVLPPSVNESEVMFNVVYKDVK